MEIYLIALCLLIILVLFYIGWNCSVGGYEEYMEGMWKGDSAFTEESGVSSMLLYIGESSGGRRVTRECYLVINDDITSQPLKITYKKSSTGFCVVGQYTVNAAIEFEEEEVFPTEVTMEFSLTDGSLRIYSDGVLYGLFYRDNELSAMADSVDM